MGRGALEGFSVAVLLKHFLAPVAPGQADAYEHVATVLPNVTRIAAGRKLLLQPGRGLLQALASQVRRLGVPVDHGSVCPTSWMVLAPACLENLKS